VFTTKSLLELGGDECDFMNFKIDSFKIRKKIREFQELLKFVKYEFAIYGLNQRSCATLSLVSSEMADCLLEGKLSHSVTSHPGQLNLPSSWVSK